MPTSARRVSPAALALLAGLLAATPSLAQTAEPTATTRPTTRAAKAERPPIVSRAEWGGGEVDYPESYRHEPKVVLVHHAGVLFKPGTDPAASVRGLLRFSREDKGWPDVPYHFVIAPDGAIYEGRDVNYKPDTNTKFDTAGYVNVELLGNFEEQRVSPAQLDSLARLTAHLADEIGMRTADLVTHKNVAPGQTTCPGRDLYRYFESGAVARAVDACRAGEPPRIDPLPPLPDGPTEMIPDAGATLPSNSARQSN